MTGSVSLLVAHFNAAYIVCTHMKKTNICQASFAWRVCRAAALLLAVVGFSPVVIPMGSDSPRLFQLPVTLWAGGLISLGFLGLTIVAVRVRPGRNCEIPLDASERAAERAPTEAE